MELSPDEIELFAEILWDEGERHEVIVMQHSGPANYQPVPWSQADDFDHEEYRERAARLGEAFVTQLVAAGRLGPRPMQRFAEFITQERGRLIAERDEARARLACRDQPTADK